MRRNWQVPHGSAPNETFRNGADPCRAEAGMTSYSTPTAAGSARFASIQFCRCLAATLVVLYHTDLQIMRLIDGRHLQLGFGAAGTDMLFVISGFVLVLTTHGRSVHIGSYVFKRFARIAPLYWASTLAMLAMFLIAPALFYSTAFDARHFLASMLFIPYAHPVIGRLQPFLVPGWALNQIAFFYVLFGLGLLLPSRFRVPAVTLVLVALVMRRWFLGSSDALLDFYGMPVVLDFALGMLVCRLYLSQDLVSGPVIGAVFAVSAAIFAAGVLRGTSGGDDRILYWGIADAGVLFSLLSIERTWGWWNPGLLDAPRRCILLDLSVQSFHARHLHKSNPRSRHVPNAGRPRHKGGSRRVRPRRRPSHRVASRASVEQLLARPVQKETGCPSPDCRCRDAIRRVGGVSRVCAVV